MTKRGMLRADEDFMREQAAKRERWAKEPRVNAREFVVDVNLDAIRAQLEGAFVNPPRKSQKYGNVKTGGYDSAKEAKRAADLQMLERGGYISELREQVEYLLIPAQRDEAGKVIERACTYTADFVYKQDGQTVVEDSKGYPNDRWPIKRKLMLFVHNIRVRET